MTAIESLDPPTEPGLTARQHAVLEVIRTSVSERGYPPSLREIGAGAGLSSINSVWYQVHALERKGYLRCNPGSPRAITLTDTAAAAVSGACPTCGRRGAE